MTMTTERFSQIMNVKDSMSTIEGEVLQSVSCSLDENEDCVTYVNTTKQVIL